MKTMIKSGQTEGLGGGEEEGEMVSLALTSKVS